MRQVFELSLSGDVVKAITFLSQPLPASDTGFVATDHTDLAAQIAADSGEIACIVVVADRLKPDLWDNPAFARWTASVGACEARVAARRAVAERALRPGAA